MSDASYYLYKKQFSYDGTNWFDVQPLTYSYDGDGTMQPVINTYHDEDCKEDYSTQYLTFESLDDNNEIYWKASDSSITKTISASTDNGETWTAYTSSTGGSGTTLATLNAGDKVLLKGENAAYATYSNYNQFKSTGQFEVYGNIMSLISGDSFDESDTLGSAAFQRLFLNSSTLVSAKNLILPATTLTAYCYDGMFYNCSNLTSAPELPALNLARYCYAYMFDKCASLTAAPELPATTLAVHCYELMFSNCTSLTTAPELPALNLANYCYYNMFYECASLTTAPELPATTLAEHCYEYMFGYCTSLTYIKCLATDKSAYNCTAGWVFNVSSTGTFVKNAAMNDWSTGTSGIPSGWAVQNA